MRSIFLRLWLACGGLLLLLPVVTHAARDANGPLYPVSAFAIEYALDHPRHLDERDVLDLEVGLTAAEAGYVAPRPVDRTVRLRLSSLPRNAYFSATAIQHINQYIVSSFNRRGYNGVIVTVPDIEEGTGRDLRAPNETTLRLQVWTGRVSRVTSLADGERYASLSSEERTDHPNHGWIRDRAPVQPGGLRGLLDVAAAEDYAAKLSRHPGPAWARRRNEPRVRDGRFRRGARRFGLVHDADQPGRAGAPHAPLRALCGVRRSRGRLHRFALHR
jgi:hypothetical protein